VTFRFIQPFLCGRERRRYNDNNTSHLHYAVRHHTAVTFDLHRTKHGEYIDRLFVLHTPNDIENSTMMGMTKYRKGQQKTHKGPQRSITQDHRGSAIMRELPDLQQFCLI